MKALMMLFVCMLLTTGCNEESAPPAPKAAAVASAEKLPAELFTSTAPANAIDVVAARNSVKDGETVVIKARIAGAKEPFAPNRAILTVADLSLPTCDQTPNDNCPTPWDACCVPSEEIATKIVAVQVVGADGRPLKSTLAGANGLAPLKQVVIAGVMHKSDGNGTPIIEAKQIFVP